jgi:hypothetical protein
VTVLEAVLACCCGLLALGWARSAWISGDTRAALATAQDDRDTYAAKLADLHARQGDDTVRLPRWQEFLPAQPQLPADPVTEMLADLERHANGEGR